LSRGTLGQVFTPAVRVIIGKDKKKVEKSTAELKADDVTASAPTTEQLRTALVALQKEPLPASPQDKEAYFMTQVSLGEQMAAQGESIQFCVTIMEKLRGL